MAIKIPRKNVIKLMSIIGEKILIDKFDLTKGAHKIEQRLRKGESIPALHVKSYRIFRPKSFETWMGTLLDAIKTLLKSNRRISDIFTKQGKIFWNELEEEDWIEIGKMLDRIFNHKIWLLDNSRIINAIGSSKKEICQDLLLNGKVDGEKVIDTPLDFKYLMGI